ncbi:MAG: GNAT family N-acetyltransferase [Pseudomonadota bacterium]
MVRIVPIALDHAPAFRLAVDAVAREGGALAGTEAPPDDRVHAFVAGNIAAGNPQFVALDGDRVVGWCDILRRGGLRAHCGTLGMGVLRDHRRRGLGRDLLRRTLDAARAAGIERVELTVRASNAPARRLYEAEGFTAEGRFRGDICTERGREDSIPMALDLTASS